MSIFKRSPNVEIGDLDRLLELAGVSGGFKGIVQKVGTNVQNMRTKATILKNDATSTQNAAQKVFDEKTRAARKELEEKTAGVTAMLAEASVTATKATEASALLNKYNKI